ncbi:unnamed protein product [Prunus armeniaca]
MLADVEQMAEAIEEELERRALKGKSCKLHIWDKVLAYQLSHYASWHKSRYDQLVNNQDEGDRTSGTREVVTRAEFETLFAAVEEESTERNEGARVQCLIVESDNESEQELQEQPSITRNQNNRNQYMDDFRIKDDIPYFNGHL